MNTLHTDKQYDHALPPFDELVRMAKNDPQAFEQFRQDRVREMIEAASETMQPRLKAQQSHIERVISNCKNPHHTNVVLMNELRKQVMKFRDALQGTKPTEQTHNVVQFKSRRDSSDGY